MEPNYINRITARQLDQFMALTYPGYEYTVCLKKDNITIRTLQNHAPVKTIRLYDFQSVGIEHSNLWARYLYDIFGEEYKEAYINQIFA